MKSSKANIDTPGTISKGNMTLNWFLSRTVRQANQMRKHVQKILNAQRDILSPQAVSSVEESMGSLHATIGRTTNKAEIKGEMGKLEATANKWLKAYPSPNIRENIEVLLVAIAVAMGIRTFFLQPFKIPTGSMQPTLYGITSTPDFMHGGRMSPSEPGPEADFEIPNPVSRFFQFWFSGVQYVHVVARSDGALRSYDELPSRFLLFNWKQQFYLGDDPKPYTVLFPTDNLFRRAGLVGGAGLPNPKVFKQGETIIKLKVVSGDHLFVDRLTYNFRHPKRGEIVVFETRGIEGLPPDQFYIKRMVALGGEQVSIGNDRHLVIDGKRLDANTPHFDNVYSFPPSRPPIPSVYSGHVNGFVAPGMAPLFPNEDKKITVQPNHYMVMGDNTMNSSDSRFWGDFTRTNVIGKSYFVYWPIGRQNGRASRFGWGH